MKNLRMSLKFRFDMGQRLMAYLGYWNCFEMYYFDNPANSKCFYIIAEIRKLLSSKFA